MGLYKAAGPSPGRQVARDSSPKLGRHRGSRGTVHSNISQNLLCYE